MVRHGSGISVTKAMVALFVLAAGLHAQDSQLETLRATLISLRANADEYVKNRVVAPELAAVKRQLRDWIESQLQTLKTNGDEKVVESTINDSIKAAGLTSPGDRENLLGYLGDVELSRESGLLILKTAVGILCQHDQSAYAYQWIDDRWKRIWESEQSNYAREKYFPQFIESIHVWQPHETGRKAKGVLLLTLGHDWGCASTWHNVYWRLWRIDPSGTKSLVDSSHWAWLRANRYIIGSIGSNHEYSSPQTDVLIEFTQDSIDVGVHNREAIRHYVIDQDRARRIDPVALSPRDFVDEWLRTPWNESADWSGSPALHQWHQKLDADFISGEFSSTMHCQSSDLWQVTLTPQNAKKNFEDEPRVYFLVRWRPPYHFSMMNVSNKPWPLCKQEDPEADEWRTLFSVQEWR
jgi:hypothetical protein